MVISVSGANGGYKLIQGWEKISLLDVIKAIEGLSSMSDNCLNHNPNCLIQKAIESAENKFLNELNQTHMGDLANQIGETSLI